MHSRRKATVLWGVVGALLFLVLAQGYRLYAEEGVGLPLALIVAVGVGIATAAGSCLVERRIG